jgi:hypothetical protein
MIPKPKKATRILHLPLITPGNVELGPAAIRTDESNKGQALARICLQDLF